MQTRVVTGRWAANLLYTTILAVAALFSTPILAVPQGGPIMPVTIPVSFSTAYDNKAAALSQFACSNTFANTPFKTLGDLKVFPDVGGASHFAGTDSPACGSCWKLTFNNTLSVNFLVVDAAGDGAILSQEAFSTLTGGQVGLGRVQATAQQVDHTQCQF